MKWHNRILTFLLVFLLLTVGCGSNKPRTKLIPESEAAPPKTQLKAPKLPWENDPEFVRILKENGARHHIATYQAKLPDPILFERHNIALAAEYLKGAVVKPDEVFSLNRRLGWRSAERGFKPGPMYMGGRIASTVGGGVCKIASVMYNVTILADQEVVERHPHSMKVPYVPPGQDATISYGTKDFKFRNTTKSPIVIWAKNTGDTLYMAFYGSYKPPKIKWIHETISTAKTRTEYVWDYNLPKGTEKTVSEGFDGIVVHSKIEVVSDNGKKEIRDLGISSYRPCPRIVAKGSR